MKDIVGFLLEHFFKQITALGTLFVYLVIVGAFFLAGQEWFATVALVTLVVNNAAGLLIKSVVRKDRPVKQHGRNTFEKVDASSFPSIHSMRAAALGILFALFFGDILFDIFIAVLALAIMYSRVYLKRHYFADVVAGAILGTILTGAVLVVEAYMTMSGFL